MLQCSTLPTPPPLHTLGQAALFLDFDGTLVEIAADPDGISVGANLGQRLESLAGKMDGRLCLVSGRSVANLRRFLGPVELHLAGSHGTHVVAKGNVTLKEAEALPPETVQELSRFAADSGLLYERKAHGGALHFRNRPDFAQKVIEFAGRLAGQHGLETKQGKCVVEIVRPGADKGGAVRLLMQRSTFAGALPVFVGDDVTDEDGMAAAVQLGGVGIAVGERPFLNATYHLPSVKDVHAWLNL